MAPAVVTAIAVDPLPAGCEVKVKSESEVNDDDPFLVLYFS